ncbi:hypothetical protein G647_05685 [Cladophialophora carrionii CBS 160.54]|uniref:SWI/SNF family DNA-dependent ATPase Ris1 n=1 Tax=Cladophialophora carrionii CBS 160.54 TaxID=1279043 RepID=V9DC57_9EURO|nr:uncharacterized protein G647_05685 [Cladophialophora carrionii CBS 160.54]ETI23878.1 hypothetical protein G647_05685 [Cladophialophora carrionii CBS 160.54]
MDGPSDPALLAEIEDLRDEIALKEAILESLNDNGDGSEDEELRKTAKKELKRLRKHLRVLQPGKPDAPTASRSPHPASRSNHLSPLAHYPLASRKRPRTLSNDERQDSFKSRRTTPTSTLTAPSPAESSVSLDSLDDPFLDSLFGGLTKEELEHNQDFWRQKQQEENDEKFAQSLSQEWAGGSATEPTQPTLPYRSDYTQSFLRSDGSFVKSEPSHNANRSTTIKGDPVPADISLTGVWEGPATFRPVKHEPARHGTFKAEPGMGPSLSMPGAFPDALSQNQAYDSLGGFSVYSSRHGAGLGTDSPDRYTQPRGQLDPDLNGTLPDSLERSFDGGREHAQTQAELRQLLQHIRPDEELTADQMPEQPQGLKVSLMPHQLSGLAWMKRMEEGTNKGGILADDMGLGKTLQSIALMLERPPPEDKHRPTLVVAPVALMHQWRREIEKMVRPRHRMNVFILHGETRKATWSSLRAYDIVLTTYGLLASELKRKAVLDEKAKRLQNYVPTAAEDCPVLGDRSRFHRVILDEAHNIKNRNTKAAHAACRIQADYRWCLTGTPMMNETEEMFSLVKFCRIRPYCDWERFRKDIAAPLKRRYEAQQERGMATLQALLRAILLRRTKQSNIHGQPILQLPPKETTEDRVVFLEDQREFYFALENSAQIQMNRYLQRGTVGRHYANILVLLLRLRQAACHPFLVTASKDFVQLPGGELTTDVLMRNAAQLDVKVVERLKQLDAYECPICFDVTENPSLFFCGHAICGDCLSRLTEDRNDNGARPKCPQCRADIDVNNVTDYTSFLRVHCPEHESLQELDLHLESESVSDSDSDTDDGIDDSEEGDDLNGFIVYDTDPDAESSARKPAQRPKKIKKPSKAKSQARAKYPPKSLAQLRKEGLRNKSARRRYLRRLKKTFEPSAKTIRTLELLEEIKGRGENEKTIVFSNFTSFLDIIETTLYDHKTLSNYVRYDGSMSSNERNDAVLEFTENPNCSIILVSLRSGNAGLNLTAANHVIMLDPFWNPFVEYQAADRCYRIGQQRPVTIHRVLIGQDDLQDGNSLTADGAPRDPAVGYTVEDRILNLQEKKRRLVETALDESAGRQVSRLGVRELGYLFGLNSL